MVAIQAGHPGAVRMLLQHKAHQDLADFNRNSPIVTGQLHLIDAQAKDGTTCVFLAAQEGKAACLRLLLQYGASANIVTKDMRDLPAPSLPLHAALEFKHIPCVKLLIPVTDPHQFPSCAHSPWKLALDDISGMSTQCLVNHGLGVNYSHHGLTPLVLLCKTKTCTKLAEILLKGGALVNITSPRQTPPLLAALTKNNTKLLRLFIEHGAAVNIYMYEHGTNMNQTISICIKYKLWGELMLMLKCGAEVKSILTGHRYLKTSMTSQFNTISIPEMSSTLLPAWIVDSFEKRFSWNQVILGLLHFVDNVRLHPLLEEVFGSYPEWQQIVQIAERTPKSLTHLCRLVIRDQFTPKQLFHGTDLRNLPLPAPLKDYLRYTDIFENSPLFKWD